MFKVFSQNTGLQDKIINLTENIISTISSYQISPNIKIFNPDIVFKKKKPNTLSLENMHHTVSVHVCTQNVYRNVYTYMCI